MNPRDRITALVGRLSDAEMGIFFGRFSAVRRWAKDRGVERLIPPPPPEHEDPTLQYKAAQATRGVERLTRKASPNRGIPKALRGITPSSRENQ